MQLINETFNEMSSISSPADKSQCMCFGNIDAKRCKAAVLLLAVAAFCNLIVPVGVA